MANLAALRSAVFFAICEKPEGWGVDIRPPAVRGLSSRVALNMFGWYWHQNKNRSYSLFPLSLYLVSSFLTRIFLLFLPLRYIILCPRSWIHSYHGVLFIFIISFIFDFNERTKCHHSECWHSTSRSLSLSGSLGMLDQQPL